jgi:hypothetical protein
VKYREGTWAREKRQWRLVEVYAMACYGSAVALWFALPDNNGACCPIGEGGFTWIMADLRNERSRGVSTLMELQKGV